MKTTFSPKQVARAFDVSESSLKRWCDRGMISMIRTAGGHRRIALSDIVSFVRESDQPLARPELLGLPPISGVGERVLSSTRDHFLKALSTGDESACRRLVFELFMSGYSISQICDEVLTSVMKRVGELWECGNIEVYQERLGCEICSRVLDDCRDFLTEPEPDAPLAIGGTPSTDPYTLPTRMAELTLREVGWRGVSLGTNLPFETLCSAVRDKQPKLVWLSVSCVDDADEFLDNYQAFQSQLDKGVALVVGGRALTESLRRRMKFFAYCEDFGHLSEMGRTLREQKA